MAKKKKSNVADSLGKGLAHIQDGIDRVAEWAFTKMKDVDGTPAKKRKDENEYVHKAKEVGKKTLGFIGRMGESFYDNYEDLKQKRKK